MNAMLSPTRRSHITRVVLPLVIVALIAGTTGCVGEASRTVKYDLTIASGEGGSVTVPGEGTFACDSGRVVDLVATPTSGYRFLKWTGNVATIANPNVASTTITMNGNYSITATFEETEATFYTLTVGVTGSGSVNPTAGSHTYGAGAVISIVATPAAGYQFSGWSGDMDTIANVNAASTTVTMNDDYSIIANFEETAIMYYTLTVAATGGGSINPTVGQYSYAAGAVVSIIASATSGYYFVNWTGNVGTIANVNAASTTITMHSNYSITANFAALPPGQYSLIISSGAGGSVTTPGEGTFVYGSGTVVNLVATPTATYEFVNWTGNVGTIANVNAASTTITMDGNHEITANFYVGPPIPYNLTVSSSTGGLVTTPGEGIFGYGSGMVVNLVAVPASGYQFLNWTGNVGTIVNVNAASTTITMNNNYSITANFGQIPEYELTISSTIGGSVATPGEGAFTYYAGTVVSLAAIPTSGYAFVNWTGNVGTIANVNAAYTTITTNGNYSVIANFELGDWVFFPDPALEAALRAAIGRPTGRIYESDLEGLTSFFAAGSNIADITGLEYCINLVTLDLHDNQISDISALAGLTKLEWLDLSHNRISDVSSLAGLTNLKWLYLYNNRIGSVSPLANLTNLTYLFLYMNQISSISPLANLTNLTRLLLFSNQISDISPLANLTKLNWLYLQRNQISDIAPLANLTSLTQLDLSYNQITGIAAIYNLTSLTYLALHSTQISDISVLANFTHLMWLYLQNDLITSIYPLTQNGGLGTGDRVYLGGNPLSGDSTNIYIPELVARGVIVSY